MRKRARLDVLLQAGRERALEAPVLALRGDLGAERAEARVELGELGGGRVAEGSTL